MEKFTTILSLFFGLIIFQAFGSTSTDVLSDLEIAKMNLENNREELAIIDLKKASQEGSLTAQCLLGECYEKGIGTQKDSLVAFSLYKDASKKGNAKATYLMARCYENGIGTSKNEALAFKLYNESYKNGYKEAKYDIEKFYASTSNR